ncbi:MAG: hypothetical protein ACOVNK_04955, partial [Sphingorhabdus lacus]
MAEGVRIIRQKEKGKKEENTAQLSCDLDYIKSLVFPYFLFPSDEKENQAAPNTQSPPAKPSGPVSQSS